MLTSFSFSQSGLQREKSRSWINATRLKGDPSRSLEQPTTLKHRSPWGLLGSVLSEEGLVWSDRFRALLGPKTLTCQKKKWERIHKGWLQEELPTFHFQPGRERKIKSQWPSLG